MILEVFLTKEAEQDIDHSYLWYESQIKGLGKDFVKHVNNVFLNISKSPELNKKVYKQARCAFVKRFPFLVFYTINIQKQEIIVIAVLHYKRNPKIIRKRKPAPIS